MARLRRPMRAGPRASRCGIAQGNDPGPPCGLALEIAGRGRRDGAPAAPPRPLVLALRAAESLRGTTPGLPAASLLKRRKHADV